MPYFLRHATIDFGFPRLTHAQKRAMLPFIADGVDDHTIETLTTQLEKASAAAGGARIEAAMEDELDVEMLVVIDAGKTEKIIGGERYAELIETSTEELLGETFGGTLTFGFPGTLGERIEEWRMKGGSPSQLVAELWTRAYPAIAKAEATDIARVEARFPPNAKRTKVVATVDALTHFDMLHEAARLGTKISPLLLYAFCEHGGHRLTDT